MAVAMTDSTEVFIEEYRAKHRNLWDVTCRDYTDRNLRLESLKALCPFLGLEISDKAVKDVKQKVNSLRTTYGRELRKVKDSQKSGAGTDDLYQPKWKYFFQLDSFLRPFCTQRKGKTNFSMEVSIEHADVQVPMLIDEFPESEMAVTPDDISQLLMNVYEEKGDRSTSTEATSTATDTGMCASPVQVRQPFITNDKKAVKRKRKTPAMPADDEALGLMKSIKTCIENRENRPNNPFSAFGKYVAEELLQMDPTSAKLAKKEINEILFNFSK